MAITVPALTILFHPNLKRLGERVLLSELLNRRDALISRDSPEFTNPEAARGAPLDDPYISRTPFRLAPLADQGILVSRHGTRTRIRIDGEPLSTDQNISNERLASGVVLELSDRVVLLLHDYVSSQLRATPSYELVGSSWKMEHLRVEITRVADLDVPVLLRGETGTGKELVSRAIHQASLRSKASFVSVNMGALPSSLAGSELFGSVKGAYTGSVQNRTGFFRQAHAGTLLLDEIGEAPPEIQVMLLRVLETGEIFPVGAQAPQKVDVRIVAATDADLEENVASGQFRAPLLHRLAGFEVWLPPLRERRDDLGRLLIYFMTEELTRIGEAARLIPRDPLADPWLPASVVAKLAMFSWPGNVRQLRNVVRQLVIGSRGATQLTMPVKLDQLFRKHGPLSPNIEPFSPPTLDPPAPPPKKKRRKPSEIGEEELNRVLRENRWDIKATAEALRISRTSLYGLIDQSPQARVASDLSPQEISDCHHACAGNLEAMVEQLEISKSALRRRLRELDLSIT